MYRILPILIILLSCQQTPKSIEFQFVRNGIALNTLSQSIELKSDASSKISRIGSYTLIETDWEKGSQYSISVDGKLFTVQAPQEASLLKIKEIDLDDLSTSPQGNFPDVDISISPDNKYIAVGSFYGYLYMYSLEEDKIIWQKKIAEGMIKKCLFSADSKIIYAGEQSFEANLYAFETVTGEKIWQKRLADDIDTSPVAKGDNPYYMYSLPGVFHMQLDQQGNLLVAGVHSWRVEGATSKKSVLYSINENGELNWQFPKKALNANIKYFDTAGDYIVFNVDAFDANERTVNIKNNSIVLIDVNTGQLLDSKTIPVLAPYFKSIFFWQNVSISKNASFAAMATLDGRVFQYPIENNKFKNEIVSSLGTPIMVNDIPISAGIPYTASSNNLLIASVTETSIPYSYSSANKVYEPPSLHPLAGHIYALNQQGELVWDYFDGSIYSALSLSGDNQNMIAVVDDKKENRNKQFFGYTLFKRNETGFEKHLKYQTAHPVFFRGSISKDGSIIVVTEHSEASETRQSVYKVHITI